MLPFSHSAHDYGVLLARWQALALRLDLRLSIIYEAGIYPVIALENARALAGEADGVYLSAGVHGDECAPVWALLRWAESHPVQLQTRSVVIFPCLNPHGLVENSRRDQNGVDLNRSFHDLGCPLICAWTKFLDGRVFDLSLSLHEDYDATGIYLYELVRGKSRGEELLATCEAIIPREIAGMVDGNAFDRGVSVRRDELEKLVESDLGGGYPEAILLFLQFSRNSYTFETPSEVDLCLRIRAHETFIRALLEDSLSPP